MRRLVPTALVWLFLLSSCQPSKYRILAANQGGQIVLNVSDKDRASALGARADRLTVRGAQAVMWEVEADHSCRDRNPARPFPFVYGSAPRCYRVVTPAQPLDPDRIYLVTASGARDGDGYFIPGPPVQNFEHHEVADRVSAWQPLG